MSRRAKSEKKSSKLAAVWGKMEARAIAGKFRHGQMMRDLYQDGKKMHTIEMVWWLDAIQAGWSGCLYGIG